MYVVNQTSRGACTIVLYRYTAPHHVALASPGSGAVGAATASVIQNVSRLSRSSAAERSAIGAATAAGRMARVQGTRWSFLLPAAAGSRDMATASSTDRPCGRRERKQP